MRLGLIAQHVGANGLSGTCVALVCARRGLRLIDKEMRHVA
jgi:hypothetical protein